MRRVRLLMLICSGLSTISFAQSSPKQDCPKIDLIGPAGITALGKLERYTLSIRGSERELKYFWTVNVGEIKSGQGTTAVEVVRPDSRLTVTVSIEGLPEDCPSTFSESSIWDPPPQAIRIGVLYSLEGPEAEKTLREFADELLKNPTSQGYIIIGTKTETRLRNTGTRESSITERLEKPGGGSYDRSRITSAQVESKADVIEFWRIPPGAENPTCAECKSAVCPKVSVVGPAGIVSPGELVRFSAFIEPNDPSRNYHFEWKVLGGAIVGQQDSAMLEVRPEKYFNRTTTATVVARGFPDGCPNTTSGHFAVACDGYLELSDDVSFWSQYSDLSWQDERKELDSLVLRGLRQYPLRIIYLEKTFGKDVSARAMGANIRQIRNYLANARGLAKHRFFIRTSRGDRNQTKAYLVPRDAPVLSSKYSGCLQ